MLAEMASQKLVSRDGRKYTCKSEKRHRTGIVDCHPDGYGFVQAVDSDEEFFLRAPNMEEALHGDLVRVAVAARASEDKKRECEVVEVLERRCKKVVGTFHQRNQFAFVEPVEKGLDRVGEFAPQARHLGGGLVVGASGDPA
ncbi:MAG: hypothetical protein BRD41_04260, partial [Bacteroidetes bacterium QS_1_63_11]